jgi:hypothetical protein
VISLLQGIRTCQLNERLRIVLINCDAQSELPQSGSIAGSKLHRAATVIDMLLIPGCLSGCTQASPHFQQEGNRQDASHAAVKADSMLAHEALGHWRSRRRGYAHAPGPCAVGGHPVAHGFTCRLKRERYAFECFSTMPPPPNLMINRPAFCRNNDLEWSLKLMRRLDGYSGLQAGPALRNDFLLRFYARQFFHFVFLSSCPCHATAFLRQEHANT